MKTFAKTWRIIVSLSLIYFAFLILARSGVIFSEKKKIAGIEAAGVSFADFRIPADVRVVGIGEATHGNREFQILKKQVLEKLVNEGNGRSIAFEISAGEGAMINAAIHDPESDLIALLGKQSYPLYDTEEIAELLSWMRSYNQSVPYEESLMFYGVDMQGGIFAVEYMQQLCRKDPAVFSEEERETLLAIDVEEAGVRELERAFFERLRERFSEEEGAGASELAILSEVVLQGIDAPLYEEDPAGYGEYRDRCMAENLKRFSEAEEKRAYSQILITAHNGHVMKGSSLQGAEDGPLTMGGQIDRIFDGSYYCIGSEFYNTCVNIHTAGTYDEEYERADHFYCSNDPLAYQASFFEGGQYCLDFSKVGEEERELYRTIHSPLFTGLVGEGYNILSDIGKSYRLKCVPADRYDAVVYYFSTTPIDPIHY